jgi:D-alanyl-D-alanine carboxypeptidase
VPHGGRITIRDLLNMTSGIHNYTAGFIQDLIAHPYRDWRPREIVGRMASKQRHCPVRQTGTARCWQYSDPNYIILGQILRRLTDGPLRKLYERRIFEPLGMNHTEFHPQNRHPHGSVAHGYIRDPRTGRVLDTTHWNLSWAWTAGGATSTLGDLRRWGPALATGRGVLGRAMQRKRLDVVPIPHERRDGYGLGILSLDDGQLLGHDGQPLGYDSFVLYSTAGRITTAALGNTSASQNPIDRSPADSQAMEVLGGNLLEVVASP